jgi:N6-adenosine-specific RNA methylase IME4
MNKEVEPLEPAFRDQLAEAKDIPSAIAARQKAIGLEAYAKEARDPELINHAVEVRLRAERKVGEMLRGMAERGERARGGGDLRKESPPVILSNLGVSPMQSSRWQALASLSEEDFLIRLKDAQRAATSAIELTKDERKREKQERRASRETNLAATIKALPDKRFGVILADPEWKFEVWNEATGSDRSAANHYATSELADIKARDVPSIAAKDCVLFLWATVPMLAQAIEVMAAWGFAYKSHCVWEKDQVGTGYWFRNEHELLLVGTRGDVPAPAPGTQWSSRIPGPVRDPSEKPDEFYEMIEAYFPTLPKIELNARKRRDNWEAWGAEAPEDEACGAK